MLRNKTEKYFLFFFRLFDCILENTIFVKTFRTMNIELKEKYVSKFKPYKRYAYIKAEITRESTNTITVGNMVIIKETKSDYNNTFTQVDCAEIFKGVVLHPKFFHWIEVQAVFFANKYIAEIDGKIHSFHPYEFKLTK